MKILEAGRDQKGWSTESICTGHGNGNGGCGAKLLVEQADIYMTESGDIGGGYDRFHTFTCVACGVETDLKHVPGHVNAPKKNQHPLYARNQSEK